jgi:hypothetical protein
MIDLKDTDTGRYRVETMHSSYLIDLDARTVCRTPVNPDANDLRADETVLPLHEIITCRKDFLMELMIQIRDDGIPTYRRTTAIKSIEPIP